MTTLADTVSKLDMALSELFTLLEREEAGLAAIEYAVNQLSVDGVQECREDCAHLSLDLERLARDINAVMRRLNGGRFRASETALYAAHVVRKLQEKFP